MGKLAELRAHPDEVLPTIRMYLEARRAKRLPKDPDLAFCFGILNAVSRSFGVVINQLPAQLRDAVCVFYLVLRALDTVEDDMEITPSVKVPLLKDFYNRIRDDPAFSLVYGKDHYQRLLNEFPKVHRVMKSLKKEYQDVILDITRRMGDGMAEFILKDVVTVEDYDQYCFYVAGLVGVGLSNLFASSGLETEKLREKETLSAHMGWMLQKINIVRDYLEDISEEPAPRMFWPKEIWGQYAEKLEDFKLPSHRTDAVKCLNHLIVDILRHVKSCFEYMEMIKTPYVFRFCAIPQVMAIATAALCFDNEGVFEGVVKVRRGLTCRIFQDLQSMSDVYSMFERFIDQIADKIPEARMEPDVKQKATKLVQETKALCIEGRKKSPPPPALNSSRHMLFALIAVFFTFLYFLVSAFYLYTRD